MSCTARWRKPPRSAASHNLLKPYPSPARRSGSRRGKSKAEPLPLPRRQERQAAPTELTGDRGTDGSNPSPSSGESDELRSERRSRRGRVPTFDRRVRCPYRRSPERTGCERSACRRSAWRQSSRCARNQGTKSGNTVGRLKFQEFSNAVATGPSHISAARRMSTLAGSDGSSAFRAVSAPQTGSVAASISPSCASTEAWSQ